MIRKSSRSCQGYLAVLVACCFPVLSQGAALVVGGRGEAATVLQGGFLFLLFFAFYLDLGLFFVSGILSTNGLSSHVRGDMILLEFCAAGDHRVVRIFGCYYPKGRASDLG